MRTVCVILGRKYRKNITEKLCNKLTILIIIPLNTTPSIM